MADRKTLIDSLSKEKLAFLRPDANEPEESKQESKHANNVPDVLTSFAVRLPLRVQSALREASFKRRATKTKPDTQQEIVATAVEAWLKANEYL